MKALLLGTALTTGAIIFSLRQIPDPAIPHQIHRQVPIVRAPAVKEVPVVNHHVKVAHAKTHSSSAKLAKQKAKHKPYFLARAGNA